jgi:DNA-binding NarL/FixJ family response regulator
MTAATGLRILLADDHAVVLKGLRQLLGAQVGWQVCGEAMNGRETVEKVNQLRPDLLVLDLNMPELNGLEVTRQIRKSNPQTEVLILTMHESEQMMRQALAAGARGYLLKSDAGSELLNAVESVRHHHTFLSSRASQMLGQPSSPSAVGGTVSTDEPLSPRERQILQLLAEGKSTKEVAIELDITVKTAETHRSNIMRKLDLHCITDLVRYAIRNQIVEP